MPRGKRNVGILRRGAAAVAAVLAATSNAMAPAAAANADVRGPNGFGNVSLTPEGVVGMMATLGVTSKIDGRDVPVYAVPVADSGNWTAGPISYEDATGISSGGGRGPLWDILYAAEPAMNTARRNRFNNAGLGSARYLNGTLFNNTGSLLNLGLDYYAITATTGTTAVVATTTGQQAGTTAVSSSTGVAPSSSTSSGVVPPAPAPTPVPASGESPVVSGDGKARDGLTLGEGIAIGGGAVAASVIAVAAAVVVARNARCRSASDGSGAFTVPESPDAPVRNNWQQLQVVVRGLRREGSPLEQRLVELLAYMDGSKPGSGDATPIPGGRASDYASVREVMDRMGDAAGRAELLAAGAVSTVAPVPVKDTERKLFGVIRELLRREIQRAGGFVNGAFVDTAGDIMDGVDGGLDTPTGQPSFAAADYDQLVNTVTYLVSTLPADHPGKAKLVTATHALQTGGEKLFTIGDDGSLLMSANGSGTPDDSLAAAGYKRMPVNWREGVERKVASQRDGRAGSDSSSSSSSRSLV